MPTLHFRHQRLFRHLADLWRPAFPIPAGEFPGDTQYELAEADVPCLFDTKSAVDRPELLGLIEGEDMITVDTVRFPAGTEIDSSWVVVNKSLTPEGAEGLNYGRGWVVKGAPVRDEDWSPSARSGMVEAYVTRLPALPAGVE